MNDQQPELGKPLNPFEQVEAVCAAFRQGWKRGRLDRIETLLNACEEAGRANLFRNLLHIEIEARRRLKQNPTSDEYIQRFPQFARLIRQAFFESTMLSLAEFQNTPPDTGALSAQEQAASIGDGQTVSFAIPAANRLGDYRLLRELGRGGFGIVYAAQHVRRNEIMALKTLPLGDHRYGLDDAERLHKFRREFRSLADTNHPNLVGMQTLEVDGGQWFFTMDLVDGVDFLGYVRPDGALDEARLRGVLPQLAGGVMALHARHIIHRDLKPSNVLVDQHGRVVILDFGLVVELEQGGDQTQSLQSGRFAGTPLFAAPEQMLGERSAASDWYAVGVMLYQALTDERPFQGSAFEIMQQKQQRSAPRLAGKPELPADLAELTDRLLAREPHIRPDALEIARVFSLDAGQTPTATFLDEGSTASSGRDRGLIGRERQLAELDLAKRQFLMTRQPLALLITGRSGEGKTSLAEAFLAPVRQQREMLVLAGRCYDRESVPFKAIDCLIDALVGFLRGCPGEVVQACIPDDMPMLAYLFPILRRVEAINALPSSNVANLDGKQVRDRGFAALRQMLVRIGQRQPIALFVDDLQWGDADSAAVLHRLLSPPEAPAVLLLGTYRSDEAAESPFLQQWEKLSSGSQTAVAQREIAVGPLSEAQCVAMVVGRIGIDNESIRAQATRLFRDTGGNPYFIEQLIECFDPETGSFTPAPLQEVVARRLGKLPTEAAELLQVIAVFGQAMSIDEAFAVLGQENPSFATITHMRSERLVRLLGSEEQRTVDTYHDKIRETVISGLSADQRRNWHRHIGEMIESVDRVAVENVMSLLQLAHTSNDHPIVLLRPNDLAFHFHAAGQRAKALVYGMLSAEAAKRQFAHEAAVNAYEIARSNLTKAESHLMYRLCAGLGESLVRLARHDQAVNVLQLAADSTTDIVDKCAVLGLQAESEFRHGSINNSIEMFRKVLAKLGVRLPASTREARLRWIWRFVDRFAITPRLMLFLRRSQPDKRKEIIQKSLNILSYAYFYESTNNCLWALFTVSVRALRIEETSVTATSTEHTANGLMVLGIVKPALRLYEEAIQIADRHNDMSARLNAMRLRGLELLVVGRPRDAIASLEVPLAYFKDRLPDLHRFTTCLHYSAQAHLALGDLKSAATVCKQVFSLTLASGMDRIAAGALETWCRAVEGQLPLENLQSCIGTSADNATKVQLRGAEVYRLLENNRFAEAVSVADSALSAFKSTWPMVTQTCFVIATAARAHRALADSIKTVDNAEARNHWRHALQVTRYGLFWIQFMRCEHPALLREFALAIAALGRPKRALRAARKSCRIAEAQDASYQLAQSRMVVAELSQKLNLAGADALFREATQELQRFKDMIDQAVAETVKP